MKDQQMNFKTQSTLLPILLESVNSTGKTLYGDYQTINEASKPITKADYNHRRSACIHTCKKVQWTFPDQFLDVLWMIDPLHIEMVFLDAIGNWLDGSGWTSIFERAKITTMGQIESYLSGNKVKQTRYTHQVSMALLIHLSFLSFQK